MPHHKCMLWYSYSLDWLKKQITQWHWSLPNDQTYDTYEKYCLILSSKVWKFLFDDLMARPNFEKTRPFMQGVYILHDEMRPREPNRSYLRRLFSRGTQIANNQGSIMFTQQFSESLLYEIKISL